MYFLPLRNIVFVFIELFYSRQLILFAYVENGFWKMKHWWWCSSGQVANVDGTQYNAGEWVAASFYKALWRFISSECFFCLYPLRTSRKLFRKRFGVSARGESRFPKGLMFPRMSKVVSRMVWSFCRTQKHLWEVGLCVAVCLWLPIIFFAL